MNKPEFSVVIPLYNNAEQIINAIESVQLQKYPVDEIIVVDDGSTDNGAERIAQANLPKVRLIIQNNQGVAVARNTGVRHAKNPYIAFMNANDQWMPFFTEEMAMLITHFPEAEFYASRYQCIDQHGICADARIRLPYINPYGMLIDNYFSVASRGDTPFVMSSSVIKKTLFVETGGFPAGESAGEDQELFVKVALKGPIAYSPNVHVRYYRVAGKHVAETTAPVRECPFSARLGLRLKNSQMDEQLQRDIERYCAAHLCHAARQNLLAGHYANALALLNDTRANRKPVYKLLFGTLALMGLIQQQVRAPARWFKHSN